MAASVKELLGAFHARTPIRAGSLIVTVFGDAVAPRGGSLSLVSLIAIMRAFGINDGLVRTALSRLVADGWFERAKIGRNSFYTLTDAGRRTFAEATRRIYDDPERHWDGAFALVLLDNGDARDALRASLATKGFGALAPGVLVSADGAAAKGAEKSVVRLTARADDHAAARKLARRVWPIRAIEARYRQFMATFEGVHRAVGGGERFGDVEALVVRILLIHDYRRVILKDPLLPAELLPSPWAGAQARHLCADIYRVLAPLAERWVDANATSAQGPLPPPDSGARLRFADRAEGRVA